MSVMTSRIPRVIRAASLLPVSEARQAVRLAALMCSDPTDPREIFRMKTSIPSDMLSEDWNPKQPGEGSLKQEIPEWIRERSFFMAGVDRAEVLDGFRQVTDRYVAGEINMAKSKELLAETLQRTGYVPKYEHAEKEGEKSIKDLRSERRQETVLNFQQEQVHEYLRWVRAQQSLGANPARRLVRVRDSKMPRDWQARWAKAASNVSSEGVGDMVALTNHPIWCVLSRFGNPYPPFDYNSGMGLRVVGYSEAEGLGILPTHNSPPAFKALMQPQDRSLNESLELSPEIRSQKIREELGEKLKGFAEFTDDGRLLMTDPNGTRPYDKYTLTKVASAELPDGFANRAWDALGTWLKNSPEVKWKPGANATYHVVRYAERTVPETGNEALWRGEGYTSLGQLLKRIDGLSKKNTNLGGNLISFSKNRKTASDHSESNGQYRLIIRCDRHHTARDLSPALDLIDPAKAWQKEVVFLGRSVFEPIGALSKEGNTIILHLGEVR